MKYMNTYKRLPTRYHPYILIKIMYLNLKISELKEYMIWYGYSGFVSLRNIDHLDVSYLIFKYLLIVYAVHFRL